MINAERATMIMRDFTYNIDDILNIGNEKLFTDDKVKVQVRPNDNPNGDWEFLIVVEWGEAFISVQGDFTDGTFPMVYNISCLVASGNQIFVAPLRESEKAILESYATQFGDILDNLKTQYLAKGE